MEKMFIPEKTSAIAVEEEQAMMTVTVVAEEGRKDDTVNYDERKLEIKVTDAMLQLGVPAHLRGYYYIREAIMMTICDSEVVSSVTKLLYPQVARKFKTTVAKVERAIRNAIEISWARNPDEIVKKYGYIGKSRPTNSEFISLVADRLSLEMKYSKD